MSGGRQRVNEAVCANQLIAPQNISEEVES